VIETRKGVITLELFPHVAPVTVANFVRLAQEGFYDGLLFHRVVPDFVIQGGDPRGDGWGGPGYTTTCEYSPMHFDTGTLGMAHSGKDTAGSQFFITHAPMPHLEGRYTVFGRVVSGQETVDTIELGDAIQSIRIEGL
jgi:peptidyl-prolyl cis-trans isomerase B (cyclophilin B)